MNPYFTTSSPSSSQTRPAGSSEIGDANRTVHVPPGPSIRSSARQSSSKAGDTRGPRSSREPPASDSANTAGPCPLPAHRHRARRPPGYPTVASRGSREPEPTPPEPALAPPEPELVSPEPEPSAVTPPRSLPPVRRTGADRRSVRRSTPARTAAQPEDAPP